MTRSRPRCTESWYGDCDVSTGREHACARPPGHPPPHMCRCSERPPEDGQIELISLADAIGGPGRALKAHMRIRRGTS